MEEQKLLRALGIAKKLAEEAGRKIMEVYGDEKLSACVKSKPDHSPLTAADRLSNAIITAGLKKEFPGYAVLWEEEQDDGERRKNDYCFIVDPLDGTKEFLKRNGQFTVNIALAYRHKSVMGVIYAPAYRELYYAAEAMGSFLQTEDGSARRLHVSDITEHDRLRLVMSSSHGCGRMEELVAKHGLKNFVKLGSSLKGCLVARGDAEIYYRYNPTMEWDTAAMQCIAKEAGAVFRQMDDTPMLYNRENQRNEKGFYVINSEKNRIR